MRFLLFFLILSGIFVFTPADAADFCRDAAGWQKSNVVCDIEYFDSGGGGLQKCLYRVESYGTTTYKYPSAGENYGGEYWAKTPGTCAGDYARLTATLYVGNLLDCRDNGIGKCKLFAKAFDSPNNEQSQKEIVLLDIDYIPPTVSVAGAPSSWQQTNASASVSCSDSPGSGCSASTQRLKTDTSSGSCSATYTDYTIVDPGIISSNLWVCAAAKDVAGNIGFSSSRTEFKVDKNAPTMSLFTVSPTYPPNSVTTGQPLLTVSWIVADTGGSHLQKVTIWRASYNASTCNGTNNSGCNWGSGPEQTVAAPVDQDSWTKSFSYSPTGDGIYEYGIHVLDNAQWETTETQNGWSTKTVSIKLSNAAPTLSSVVLSPSSPFKPGVQLTFTGSWTNPEQSEGESSRLFICKNSGIPSGNNCSGGNTNNWCVSDFSPTSPSICKDYTTQAADQGTQTYYAFECDDGQGKLCSPYISGTFLIDATAPTISVFNVSPEAPNWANASNPTITISWTASDNSGGSGMKRYELWRAPDNQGSPGDWGTSPVPGKENISPTVTSTTDSPGNGVWWYGLHAVDNVENWASQPGIGKKVQVDTVPPSNPTCSPGTGTYANSVIVTCSGGRYTTNGTSPTLSSPQYTAPLTFTSSTTLTIAQWDAAVNRSGDSSYTYTVTHNQPPTASISCSPANCIVFTDDTLTFNNNSTDPDGNISTSEWDILSYGSAPDATCSGVCNHTLQPIAPNSYTMQLTVRDSAGASSTSTKNFTVKQDIVAGFMCSLDNINFAACSSLSGKISQGETLYLKDSSALSEYTTVSEGASSVTSRTWKINGSTFSSGNNANPSTTIPTQGTTTLDLTAQDNQSRSDTQTHALNSQVPFPEFQEISPF
ncbi:MAG: chitobiase/beta-hexosaminidase C-terminal domain-containing protein [Candidatus Wildermuthbacteria bacterium]|nr:chitobiase/beta-hexosaminidase C-terminal domain-containing protein [Candidatus Wildermuthbacteria bacterium]